LRRNPISSKLTPPLASLLGRLRHIIANGPGATALTRCLRARSEFNRESPVTWYYAAFGRGIGERIAHSNETRRWMSQLT